MSVLGKLASALGRNDERPNVELAEALNGLPDKRAIAELADALSTGTVAQQNDAIKVLYELGHRAPELVAPHAEIFFGLLRSKNNRLVWGAMSAIDTVVQIDPDLVAARLPEILIAADKGSVIAKDKAMSILAQLASVGEQATAMPIFLERLDRAAPNQFPMYAEIGAQIVDLKHRDRFIAILRARLGTFAPAKQARLEKVLKRMAKS